MKNRVSTGYPALLLVISAMWSTQSHAADVMEQLRDCARTENNAARAQCYEQLGKQVLADEASQEEPAPVVADAAQPEEAILAETQSGQPAPLPDNIGGGKFSDGDANIESYSGNLTRCQRASDRKWFYIFENGQIWKQVDTRKLRHKDCSGSVTIIKDGFGFKMEMQGVKGKVRIRRHR